jgi:hypothetical protein
VVVDSYGRMTSTKPNSIEATVEDRRLEYNYSTEKFEEIQNNNEINQGWIGFDIADKEDLTVKIGFGHKYNGRIDENKDLVNPETIQIDMNNQRVDTIGLISPIIDNAGHVVALNTESIKLPNGYKYIKTDKGEKIEAQNSKDAITLGTDKWLRTYAKNDTYGNSILSIGHEYPTKVLDTKSEFNINNNGDSIILETINIDEKGHITNKNQETVTLPYGYKYIKVEGEKNNIITAENT